MTAFFHYADRGVPQPAGMGGSSPVVWVPGESVACHRVIVPPVNRKKWHAMIPWLLEEHLLEQPDEIAFRAGKKDQDNSVPVVAVNKKQLALWRRELAEAGWEYSALVPDFFALPWRPGEISIAVDGERCLARFDQWQGAAGTVALLLPFIGRALAAGSAAVVVYGEGERPGLDFPGAESWRFQRIGRLFSPAHTDWLSLADGEVVQRGAGWSLPARVACGLVVVLLGLITASAVIENAQVAAQVAHLQGELRGGYRQYFGREYDFDMEDFQRVVSAQLETNGGNDDNGALGTARKLAEWLRSCSPCQLERLQIRDGELTASLSGSGVEQRFSTLAESDSRISLRPSQSGWRLSYAAEETAYE